MTRFLPLVLAPALSSPAATSEAVLDRLDRASTSFRGMTAKIRKASFTAILKETLEETGQIAMRADRKRSVTALIEFHAPDPKSIAFHDKKAQIYLPKINTVQEYDLGRYDALLSQGLLIGFATPIAELRKNYQVQVGPDEVIDGRRAHKIELRPTANAIRQHLMLIELWISETDGLPIRQKLHQQSGDFTQITYSEMKLEPALSEDRVRLRLPSNVKREYPQR